LCVTGLVADFAWRAGADGACLHHSGGKIMHTKTQSSLIAVGFLTSIVAFAAHSVFNKQWALHWTLWADTARAVTVPISYTSLVWVAIAVVLGVGARSLRFAATVAALGIGFVMVPAMMQVLVQR
jgi:hypothetical protein